MIDALALKRLLEEMADIESQGIVMLGNSHDRGYREGYRDATTYWREGIEEAILDDSE